MAERKLKKPSLAETHPELAQEWHPTKNGDLTPRDVIAGSNKKAWWLLSYDDPITNKHYNFAWEARIIDRVYKNNGCPYLSGKAVLAGFNDLLTTHPEIASQWHPTKNGTLKPQHVTAGSGKSVWWFLPYDDVNTGKHFDFEWEASIANRTYGKACPYLSGHAVWRGFNDLATTHPDIANEWHPTKNGKLTPYNVTAGSTKSVWWLLPYKNPETGEYVEFEWEAIIYNRAQQNQGCPYLSGKVIRENFNSLLATHPHIAAEWHPTKNGNLTPQNVATYSNKSVWWLLPYDDPKTGKHFDFEWKGCVADRAKGRGCPYLSGKQIWIGFNDLATTHPQLAAEWHPTKNGNLTPQDVTAGSGKKVWWVLPYDDKNTGRHFDFEWQAKVCNRTIGTQCPYLDGQQVYVGFNDLVTTHPQLAAEWHPTKNGKLTPRDVTAGSGQMVWWMLPYDDDITGKHFDFEWEASIYNRVHDDGCPYLCGKTVWRGFNDLVTTHPEIASQWHPTKNDNLNPWDITAGSNKSVWWLFPYNDPKTGKHFDFEWKRQVNWRIKGPSCPFLVGKAVYPGFNDLATTNPELAAEWHPVKNGNLHPSQVSAGSNRKVWWQIHVYDDKSKQYVLHEWQSSVESRAIRGSVCPYLNDTKTPQMLKQWARKNHLECASEYKFHDCRNQRSLPFDIYFAQYHILIECDGIQHFQEVEYFSSAIGFQKRIQNDNIKNAYCRDNNIPLLRIPYIYDPVKDKEKIEQLVLKFIETQQVPQEIIDFYAQFEFSTYCKPVTKAA